MYHSHTYISQLLRCKINVDNLNDAYYNAAVEEQIMAYTTTKTM